MDKVIINKKDYDFSNKNPSDVLTNDELDNFDKGMKLKNSDQRAGGVGFGKAVQAVVPELDALFS